MKIPWLIYLIVGGFILGFSYYMTEMKETIPTEKFYLFYGFGALFLLIALGKLLVKIVVKMREPKPLGHKPAHYMKHPHMVAPHAQHPSGHPHVKYCPSCGAAMRSHDRFCYRCGSPN